MQNIYIYTCSINVCLHVVNVDTDRAWFYLNPFIWFYWFASDFIILTLSLSFLLGILFDSIIRFYLPLFILFYSSEPFFSSHFIPMTPFIWSYLTLISDFMKHFASDFIPLIPLTDFNPVFRFHMLSNENVNLFVISMETLIFSLPQWKR